MHTDHRESCCSEPRFRLENFTADQGSRYSQESSASSLALDPPQQPQLLHLFPPHNLAANTPYVQDGASYYQPHSQLPFGAVDVRARLGSQ